MWLSQASHALKSITYISSLHMMLGPSQSSQPCCYLARRFTKRRLATSSYMTQSDIITSTRVKIPRSQFTLTHKSKTLFVGSCFSETIHSILRNNKFNTLSNPHGIVFNPHSLAKCLRNVCSHRQFTVDDVFRDQMNNDVFHSWDHHSSYSSTNADDMIAHMNRDIDIAHQQLLSSSALFITMGTSRVHVLAERGNMNNSRVVSNCHKQPGTMFTRRIMSPNEIVDQIGSALKEVKTLNPSIQIVLTVSPVRHTREGVPENSRSKSHLICAAHDLVDRFPSFVSYFPSYEIMVDELRDYRWYGEDLIHPSPSAQSYIFEQFSHCYLTEETRDIIKKLRNLSTDINHRPTAGLEASAAYRKHLYQTREKIQALKTKYGHNTDDNNMLGLGLDFSQEEQVIEERIRNLPPLLPPPL